MKLTPLAGKVIVRRDEAEKETKHGILLPDNAQKKLSRGKVLAVGSPKLFDNGQERPMDVKEGQRILFESFAGHEVELEGEKFVILDQDNILAHVL